MCIPEYVPEHAPKYVPRHFVREKKIRPSSLEQTLGHALEHTLEHTFYSTCLYWNTLWNILWNTHLNGPSLLELMINPILQSITIRTNFRCYFTSLIYPRRTQWTVVQPYKCTKIDKASMKKREPEGERESKKKRNSFFLSEMLLFFPPWAHDLFKKEFPELGFL